MRAAQAARAPSAALRLPALPGQQLFKRNAAPQQHRAAAKARGRQADGGGAAGGAYRQRQRQTVTAAASRDQLALLEQPALVLAGFYLEELATVRQLLDQAGGQAVKVVPSTRALLHAPLADALAQPEPAWDRPVPPDWEHGGGWGQQKMAVMAGLNGEQCQVLLNLFDEVELSPVVPALAAPDNLAAPLGSVLAVALKAWRARPAASYGGGSSGGAAPAAAAPAAQPEPAREPAAAAAAGPAEPAPPFVDALPPVEAVIPEEVWQPEEGSTGRGSASWRRAGGGARQDVVQAEFTESTPAQHPAQQAQQAPPAAVAGAQTGAGRVPEDVPLDLIDAIAAGVEPAGAGAFSQEEAAELAAAAEAMGLGSAQLQQLVDGVAAKAAEAMQVPFVADAGHGGADSGGATAAGGSGGSTGGGSSMQSEASKPSGSTRKPWETGSATAGGATAAPRTAAGSSAASSSRGFGASAVPTGKGARKDARRSARGSGAGLQDRLAELKTAATGEREPPAAAAAAAAAADAGSWSSNASLRDRLAELKAAAKAEPPSPAAAASPAAADPTAAQQPAQSRTAAPGAKPSAGDAGSNAAPSADAEPGDSSRPIPPVDAFVLSKEQLRGVAERHGLDFEEMLRGLAERGIGLAD
ncbi:hypothetical protein ABPG77_005522 [Micractinium sp. CCAP 211/92]